MSITLILVSCCFAYFCKLYDCHLSIIFSYFMLFNKTNSKILAILLPSCFSYTCFCNRYALDLKSCERCFIASASFFGHLVLQVLVPYIRNITKLTDLVVRHTKIDAFFLVKCGVNFWNETLSPFLYTYGNIFMLACIPVQTTGGKPSIQQWLDWSNYQQFCTSGHETSWCGCDVNRKPV